MRLPGGAHAHVDDRKLRDYLLSLDHPIGQLKARFFRAVGLGVADDLASALRAVANTGIVAGQVLSEHGTKYIVDGRVRTPTGVDVDLRTIWIVATGESAPRLVTAYPGRR